MSFIEYIVNGGRQKKKKKVILAGYRTRVAGSVVGVLNHYTTNASLKKRMMHYNVTPIYCACSSIKIHEVAV
jgi:hypothetical protein